MLHIKPQTSFDLEGPLSHHLYCRCRLWLGAGPASQKLSEKANEILVDSGVLQVRVQLGGLTTKGWFNLEVSLVTPDKDGERDGQQYVQRECRLCIITREVRGAVATMVYTCLAAGLWMYP